MTISEFASSLVGTVKERISSPLTGALVISWSVWNYKILLVLLSSKKVEDKILIVEWLIYETRWDALLHLLVGPFVTAFLIVGVYPLFSWAGFWLWAWWHKHIRKIQETVDAGRLVSRDELAQWSKNAHEEDARQRRSLEQKDARIDELDRKATEMQALIDKLTEDLAKHEGQDEKSSGKSRTNQQLIDHLVSNQFMLVFNGKLGERGRKRMLFGVNGLILEGSNENEHSWRIMDGALELLTIEQRVHNRFFWHAGAQEFVATDEDSLPAVKNQRLYPSG